METPAQDPVEAFTEYLERYEAAVGPSDYGTYAKHNGRLIKKLTFDEFEPKWKEFGEVTRAYESILANGDTINDVLVKVLRERCDELLVERKL